MNAKDVFAFFGATLLSVAAGALSVFYGQWLGDNVGKIAELFCYIVAILGVGFVWSQIWTMLGRYGDRDVR